MLFQFCGYYSKLIFLKLEQLADKKTYSKEILYIIQHFNTSNDCLDI